MYGSEARPDSRTAETRPGGVDPEGALFPNSEFYATSGDANRIMDPTCFSPEIAQFIGDEQRFVENFLAHERYECVVEVGCHAGRNCCWLSRLCGTYVGIDIDPRAIERARAEHQAPGKVEFFCATAESLLSNVLTQENHPHPRYTAVLYPFNLFGNFIGVKQLLRTLDAMNVDVALSNFNTKSATTIGRYKYYANCFDKATIRVFDGEQGVLFKAGRHFQSIAYNRSYLSEIIRATSRYHGTIMSFSIYGDLCLLTR